MTGAGDMPETATDSLLRHHHGALAAEDRARMAARIAADPEAQATLAAWAAQDAALAALTPDPGPAIPPRLAAALRDATGPRRTLPLRLAAAAAVLVFGLGLGTGWLLRAPAPAAPPAGFAIAALQAHRLYTAEIAHPVEVPASDEAHLVRWLSKRIGQQIHAPDLTPQGFRLMGGRLLPAAARSAALFMYENDGGQRLTIYVTPDTTPGTAFRHVEGDGQQGFWWTDEGLGCAIIGPEGRDRMRAIAVAAYEQLI